LSHPALVPTASVAAFNLGWGGESANRAANHGLTGITDQAQNLTWKLFVLLYLAQCYLFLMFWLFSAGTPNKKTQRNE
jgi:hypothetical protein